MTHQEGEGRRPAAASKSRSLADSAYRRIKDEIVTCALAPGTTVTEGDLSERFGFGRTPVRDALRRLEQEQLVQVHPRQGCTIAPINVKQVQDVFALRLLLETEAASLAAGKLTAPMIAKLQALCSVKYDQEDSASMAAFLRGNTEFHVTVAYAAHNDRLAEIVSNLLDNMERLFHAGLKIENRSHSIAHEHSDLLEALISGDSESARSITAAQVHKAQRMIMYGLMADPALLSVSLAPERDGARGSFREAPSGPERKGPRGGSARR